MKPRATVYVRTDARKFTFECTREVLRECFPKYQEKISHSKPQKLQSAIYKNAPHTALGERDIILTRS